MTAKIIDGKRFAEDLRGRIADHVARLKADHGITPGLAVVIVGEDPASQVYVSSKAKQTAEVGMNSFKHELPADTSEADLLALVHQLNADPAVHGILVQMPVPKHIDPNKVIEAIDPAKDVDGFHPVNVGRLSTGTGGIWPCTPHGCIKLLQSVEPDVEGLDALVIGRSNIVGKPVAMMLTALGCTVTIAHSKTRDLPAKARQADIIVAATGIPEMVKGDWVKEGAIVIDVGITRIEGKDRKDRLVGDVAFDEVQHARAVTPVPGGVGPMTIAMLMANTLTAACRSVGHPVPNFVVGPT